MLSVPESPRRRSSRQVGEESLSKAVSKNITRILEDLLKDYDKTERPSFKEGKPTQVRVNTLIRSMGPISEMEMVRRKNDNMSQKGK